METNEEKEVYFEYCKTCRFFGKSEADIPCRDCLAEPVNAFSHKPVCWKEQ